MTGPTAPFRPIGFWVKLVDRLLEDRLTTALSRHGLSRREWQVMNVLEDGALSADVVATELAAFQVPGASSVADVIEGLVERGWLRGADAALECTGEGAEVVQRARDDIANFRRSVSTGIEAEDYQRAVAVLVRIASNLGWRDDARR